MRSDDDQTCASRQHGSAWFEPGKVKPVHRLYIKTITRENRVSVPAEAHVAAR